MRKQVIFYKGGLLRFVGHLDMMRTMHRALRRADIPVAYSQGFNPHPHMSFANPLPLGCTGEKEIMELKLEREISDRDFFDQLNKELPDGLKVLAVREIEDSCPAIMALIKAASYDIILPEKDHENEAFNWKKIVSDLMAQETILVHRLGKVKGRKQMIEVDAKPLIYEAKVEQNRLHLLCACGSEENLKTELLMDALYKLAGHPECLHEESISRTALFSRDDNGGLVEQSALS